jgi:hypothetical protein
MLGSPKTTCSFCQREARKGSVRSHGSGTLLICASCYARWYGAGAECAQCHTPVRDAGDAGAFPERRAFGHTECGAVHVRGSYDR